MAVCYSEEGSLQNLTLTLDFQPSKLKNTFPFLVRHLVYGTLFWQPELTKTKMKLVNVLQDIKTLSFGVTSSTVQISFTSVLGKTCNFRESRP